MERKELNAEVSSLSFFKTMDEAEEWVVVIQKVEII